EWNGSENDRARFEETGEAFGSAFTSDARLFESAERGTEIDRTRRVDRYRADAKPARDPRGTSRVGRPHRRRETVLAAVAPRDRLVLVSIGDDDGHRAEQLRARDLGVVSDVGDDSGADEPPAVDVGRPPSPGHYAGTGCSRPPENRLDPVPGSAID